MEITFFYWLMFFCSGGIFTLWEKQIPLRQIEYKSEFLKEVRTTILPTFLFSIINTLFIWATLAKLFIVPANFIESTGFLTLPMWVRLITAYLVKDFGSSVLSMLN
ncbi:MAG: hypothetical protein RMY28_036480 [Nostoc sp. ChiSLP01]|nr:hypothetical protein [Nostoc sp. CmiSLP01]MDZ8286377.1 hypothetical protein [Nostoc sp. ChiSLP01]